MDGGHTFFKEDTSYCRENEAVCQDGSFQLRKISQVEGVR